MGWNLKSTQVLGILFGTFLLVSIVFGVKEKKIQERYSIIWIFISIFVLVISAFSGLLERFSEAIGIDYAPSAFFSILISCAYILLLNMTIITSGLRKQNKSLIQEIGLMKLQLEEFEKKIKGSELQSNI